VLSEAQKDFALALKRTDLRIEKLALAMKEGFQKVNN
jgi:hypothetical protein